MRNGTSTDMYEDWKDGYETPHAALRSLCMHLGEVESDLERLEQEKKHLRNCISEIISRLGPSNVPGIVKLAMITAPATVKVFEVPAVRALIDEWSADFPEFAGQLAACEKITQRAGSLRIEWEK